MTVDLHIPIALPLVISCVELTFVVLLFLLSRAPGWRALRPLVLSGASASVYTLTQVFFAVPGFSDGTLVTAARFSSIAASANAISWLWYIRFDRTPDRNTRFEQIVMGLLALAGVLSFMPGDLALGAPYVRPFSFYMADVRTGPIVVANCVLIITGYALVFAHYVIGARRKAPGALATAIAFALFFALAVHEACVIVGLYEAPYAIGIGFLILIFARAGIVARRVASDAALRMKLSVDLEGQVQERTSELVRVKETLMQKERLAALGQLAAGVGHEINNPLTYVLGNLEILVTMEPPLSEEARQIAEEALDGAERVRKIVRDLRALGKGSSGDRAEPVRLRDAVTGAHKLVAMNLRAKNVEVAIEADESVARFDRGRLGQVLVNLLNNAAAALPDSIKDPERRVIKISVVGVSEFVEISVADKGIGIRKEHLSRLFEPFYTTKTDSGGTGLGLYVCHSVVQSYGGTIGVMSVENEGTTVTILLPRSTGLVKPTPSELASQPMRRSSVTPTPPVARPNERILIVDDDAPVARAMARLLSAYTVDVACDVAEAKVLLAKTEYDAVVCDLRMPGLSGMALFGHLRESNPRLAKRFMLVTGGGLLPEERAELDSMGAPILTKPVEAAELRTSVKRLCIGTAVLAALET